MIWLLMMTVIKRRCLRVTRRMIKRRRFMRIRMMMMRMMMRMRLRRRMRMRLRRG